MEDAIAIVIVIAGVFLLVLCLLWILMPFLIVGTNRRLDAANQEIQMLSAQVRKAVRELEVLSQSAERIETTIVADADQVPPGG